jgi:triosephosphate isomerase
MKPMLIAGNWKMNTIPSEAVELTNAIINGIGEKKLSSTVLICPPYTNLYPVSQICKNSSVNLGAQNCYFKPSGAFTGEISIPMIKSLNCTYIIIGHSERRTYFNETDELINTKAMAILDAGLIPVICLGETLEERQSNRTFEILKRQLSVGLNNIDIKFADNIVIAYEPVWAIGTGLTASIEQIDESHKFIRNFLITQFSDKANNIPILYGGSVNSENSMQILAVADVNGALIGGASLKADSFLSIINDAEKVLNS